MNRYISRSLFGLLIVLFVLVNTYLFTLNETFFASGKPYEVSEIKHQNFKKTIQTTGIINSHATKKYFYEPHRGPLKEVLIQEGERVSIGTEILQYDTNDIEDTIALLEDEIDVLVIEQAYYKNQEHTLSSQINRATNKEKAKMTEVGIALLEQEKVKVSYQVDQIGSRIVAKENEIGRLEAKLATKTVKSSLAGIIQSVQPNKTITNKPLITITSDKLRVRAYLSKEEMILIKVGEKVTIFPNEKIKWAGVISAIGRSEGKNEYIDIEINSNIKPSSFPVGSTVKVVVHPVAKKKAIAVKHQSIVHEGENHYILVVKHGYLDKRKVSFGMGNETHQEIVTGLTVGERIVNRPNRLLVSNMNIKVKMEPTQ